MKIETSKHLIEEKRTITFKDNIKIQSRNMRIEKQTFPIDFY